MIPGLTPASLLMDRARVPDGSYLEVEAVLVRTSRLGDTASSAMWVGAPVTEPVPIDGLVAYCGPRCGFHPWRDLRDPVRVQARICDARGHLVDCTLPRALRDHGVPENGRVLFVGETPAEAWPRAMRAFAVAALALVVYVALVLLSRRRRRGQARVVEQRTWSSRLAAEDIPAAVRKLDAQDGFLVVEEGPGKIVFIQGRSENAARGWGVRTPEHFPRRTTLSWQSTPREPTQIVARIEEDLVWWPFALRGSLARLAPASIERTAAQIEAALTG